MPLTPRGSLTPGSSSPERLRTSPEAFTVDGMVPRALAFPRGLEEVTTFLRKATNMDSTVLPWGGGTHIHLGIPPERVDMVLCLRGMKDVVDLDTENLTVTVQAGITFKELKDLLAGEGRGYQIPMDVPLIHRATVGGIISSNTYGPRRWALGGVRDLLLGLKVVLANGTVLQFGGKTVKNVSGLDMVKPFIGSMGTLGVIVEATFRLLPLPTARITMIVTSEDLKEIIEVSDSIRRSPLYPSALVWVYGDPLELLPGEGGQNEGILLMLLEGTEEGLRERVDFLKELLRDRRGQKILNPGTPAEEALWQGITDLQISPPRAQSHEPGLSLRVVVPPGKMEGTLRLLMLYEPEFLTAYLDSGYIHAHWQERAVGEREQIAGLVNEIRGKLHPLKGHLVVSGCPPQVKGEVEVWDIPQAYVRLMRALKAHFDPRGILSSGRFWNTR